MIVNEAKSNRPFVTSPIDICMNILVMSPFRYSKETIARDRHIFQLNGKIAHLCFPRVPRNTLWKHKWRIALPQKIGMFSVRHCSPRALSEQMFLQPSAHWFVIKGQEPPCQHNGKEEDSGRYCDMLPQWCGAVFSGPIHLHVY